MLHLKIPSQTIMTNIVRKLSNPGFFLVGISTLPTRKFYFDDQKKWEKKAHSSTSISYRLVKLIRSFIYDSCTFPLMSFCIIWLQSSWHLLVQSKQWKYWNNMRNLFKVLTIKISEPRRPRVCFIMKIQAAVCNFIKKETLARCHSGVFIVNFHEWKKHNEINALKYMHYTFNIWSLTSTFKFVSLIRYSKHWKRKGLISLWKNAWRILAM